MLTTDDHLMHIVGKAKDQTGKVYYKVKNSWGSDSGKVWLCLYERCLFAFKINLSYYLHKDGLFSKNKSCIRTLIQFYTIVIRILFV